MSRRRLRVKSNDPSFLEVALVLALAAFGIGLALGLHIWIPLAIIGWFVAPALGYSPWLGLAAVGVLMLLRSAFGK